MRNILKQTICVCATSGMFTFVTGCQTNNQGLEPPTPAVPAAMQTPAAPVAAVQTPAAAQAPAEPAAAAPAAAVVQGAIRIKAGSTEPFKDSSGNVWQAEVGFRAATSLTTIRQPAIANTKDPGLFQSEHYSMDSFSCAAPNGKYMAKLYFAETYEGITGPGQRVFSFNVQGHEFKDFDVWVKAGGAEPRLRRDGAGGSHGREIQDHFHSQR